MSEKQPPENQEKLNEMYTRLQLIDSQVKQMQQSLQMAEQQMQELAAVKDALSDLSEVETGNEILVPVAGGIFLKAKIEDPSEVLINVGASVNVKKSITEVIGMLDTQAKEVEKNHGHMKEQFEVLFEEATSINAKISELI